MGYHHPHIQGAGNWHGHGGFNPQGGGFNAAQGQNDGFHPESGCLNAHGGGGGGLNPHGGGVNAQSLKQQRQRGHYYADALVAEACTRPLLSST